MTRLAALATAILCVTAGCGAGPASAPVGWQRRQTDPVFASASVTDVAYNAGRWAAVGNINSGGETDVAIWTSSDASSWTRVTTSDPLQNLTLSVLTSFGPGFVATGTLCGANEGCGGTGEIFLASTDGQSWSRVEQDPGTCCALGSLVAAGPGVVGVGYDFSAGFPAVPADAAVALSTDGKTWVQVSNSRDAFAGATMGDVAAGSDKNMLVAVGYGSGSAQAWKSSDGGQTWSRGTLGPGQATSIAFSGGKFVAVGGGSHNDLATWTTDAAAATWTTLPSVGVGLFNSVAAGSGVFVAGGKNGTAAIMYASNDRSTWIQTFVDQAVAADAEVKAIGADGNGNFAAFGVAANGTVVEWTGRIAPPG